MSRSSDARRRWFGLICLAVATGMLILGQTALKTRLQRQAFIYYWLTCTVLTGLTLMIALLDMRAVRRRSQQEQSELLKNVLREITDKTAEKSGHSKRE